MVKNKMNNKTKLFLFEVFVFNFFSLIGIDLAFSEELSTKAVLKREGKNLVLSANNKNYKLSCKTPGCIVSKCTKYGCRNGDKKGNPTGSQWGQVTKHEASFKGCRDNSDNTVTCVWQSGGTIGCGDQGEHTVVLSEANNCYSSGDYFWYCNTFCIDCSSYGIYFSATKYCIESECMTQGCTEWEINGKDFLALFPSVGMATIDPNNIEF